MSAEDNKTCTKCNSPYAYFDGQLWVCPECFNEWSENEEIVEIQTAQNLDAFGNPLVNGDSVTVIKDLKVGKDTIKSGTKVKSITILDEPVNGHEISCKIAGFGSIYLKFSVVKKA